MWLLVHRLCLCLFDSLIDIELLCGQTCHLSGMLFPGRLPELTMQLLTATVDTEFAVPRAQAFAHIVPINLPAIFTGYGPLPAVTATREQTGAWDAAGQTRTVQLSDGSTARERLTAYELPQYFAYTVSEFSGVLRFLAREARGEWWFVERGSGRTGIRWRYEFRPRYWLAVPLLALITRLLWRGYMAKALRLARQQLA